MVVGEVFEVPALMNVFSKQGIHVAMVVNEFGSISGMVTREDAIEEVLGELNDEFDEIERGRHRYGHHGCCFSRRARVDAELEATMVMANVLFEIPVGRGAAVGAEPASVCTERRSVSMPVR